MRVAYIVKRYPRYSETFIVNEILSHEEAGLEVEIFSLRPPNDTHFQNTLSAVRAPVHYLPSSGVKAADLWHALCDCAQIDPSWWPRLKGASGQQVVDVYQGVLVAKACAEHGIQHMHAHFGTSATSVARLASRFSGVPYTFTAHAKDIYHQSVDPADMKLKMLDAAAVVTVSQYNLRYLHEHYPDAIGRVVHINNGLCLEQFKFSATQDRPACIVAVGRLVEKKGFADLVEACGILKDQGAAFDCRIVGAGPCERLLQEQIERKGLANKVTLTGPQPQKDIVRLIQGSAVFAAPCVIGEDGNRDGLPTVLLEAMALGTCCVATDVTGIPELVENGKTGCLIGQHNPAELASAIKQYLEDPSARTRIARSARARVERDYNIQHNSCLLRDLFAQSSRQTLVSPVTQEVLV